MTIELTPALAGLAIAVLIHAASTVWWASKVNTLLGVIQMTLLSIESDLKAHKMNSFSKEDAARELAIAEKEHRALWKRLDGIEEKIAQ